MRMLIPKSIWSSSIKSSPRIFDDFDYVMDHLLHPTDRISPKVPCDVDETENHYVASFEMPGVDRKSIQVEVKDCQLLISAEKTRTVNKKTDSLIHKERSHEKLQRILELPEMVNTDNIEAHYEDGILEVVLPKRAAVQGRQIEVQSGKGGLLNRLLGDKKKDKKET